MSIEQEIRDQIERNKKLKQEVGYINNHLSILEGFCREDKQKQVDDAYKRGLKDAWEAAKKIALMDTETSEKVTGYFGLFRIMENLTPMQAIEKLKAYEEKQADRIKVRDEVIWTCDENTAIVVTSVYMVEGMEWCDGVTKDGKAYSILTKNARKTGRRFDIQSILEAMKK